MTPRPQISWTAASSIHSLNYVEVEMSKDARSLYFFDCLKEARDERNQALHVNHPLQRTIY
jgi:hypothetical protein